MNFISFSHVLHIIRSNFYDQFRYIRASSSAISLVSDFLNCIPPNVIVSFILAINKFRLSNNFSTVI